MMMRKTYLDGERGFVLATSLIMLSLLTLFSVAMYFAGRTAIQTSSSAQQSTEAFYYAETAIQYMAWAFRNDAEFDNFSYSGSYVASPFGEPLLPADADIVGDFKELKYYWDPGPTGVSGSNANDTAGTGYMVGQVMYFDNSPLGGRTICMASAALFSNCIDVTLAPASRAEPVMDQISVNLPRYIKLDIASDGSITPSIPPLPHQDPPVVDQDIPQNGAVVWITAADMNNVNKDIEIFPLRPGQSPTSIEDPLQCNQGSSPNCPCEAAGGIAVTGSTALDNAIHWETDEPTGDNIGINIVDPGTASSALSVAVSGSTITVTLATDSSKVLVSTAAEVIAAVSGNTNAATLVPIMRVRGSGSGSGTVLAENKTLVRISRSSACDANSGEWLSIYGIAAYAIGYVNGRPTQMIRAVIR
jgi:hypothetical protein